MMPNSPLARFLPNPILAPYIECYWTLELSRGNLLHDQHMPADGRVELIFNFSEGTLRSLPDGSEDCLVTSHSYVLGARAQGYRFSDLGRSRYVAVRFKPGGFFAFMPIPLSDLVDIHVPLDCLLSAAETDTLETQLEAAPTPQLKVQIIESALLKRLNPPEHLRRILSAVAQIHTGSDMLRLPEIADSINMSQKHMERLFRRYVGLRPITFSRIARVQRVLTLGMHKGDKLSLSALASAAGFFDQAHFSREFKVFTGSTPAEFLAKQHAFVPTTLPAQVVE
jgi:AraC-like DNA-binding protein